MPIKAKITAATYPMIVLRGAVAFPGSQINFDAVRKKTINALNFAMENDRTVFLVAQKDIKDDDPTNEQIYSVGCVAEIKQILKISDKNVKVLVEGLYRAKIVTAENGKHIWYARVEKFDTVYSNRRSNYKEALQRNIRSGLAEYMSLSPAKISPEVAVTVAGENPIGYIADFVAASIPAPTDDKQFVLEQETDVQKAKTVIKLLAKECDLLAIDNKINDSVKKAIDDNQKEYYLREQIKAINEELYGDPYDDEIDEYYKKIAALNAEQSVKDKLNQENAKLAKMPQGSPEASVIRSYLDECLELPYNKYTKINTDIKKSAKILDRDFYGMDKVKERILEAISVYILAPDIKGQIICLVGPPGVGKTSIAKTIAECMGRNFARVALGGIHDEAEIRGHRRTYIGSMPGKIISAVKQSGSNNSLILLDEIDKLGADYKGDPSAALLEVLDGEQNSTFCDHYIDMPYDLSKNLFVATANTVDSIPAPLLDRLEIIELGSYTREEKFNIAKKHLIKKQLKNYGLDVKKLKITDSAIYSIIDGYSREAGVRQLERVIASLCRKSAKKLADGEEKVTVTAENISSFLGKRKYIAEPLLEKSEVGIINGLAWTAVGGEIMQLEVAAVDGTGKLELTGSLGEVMQESAKAAVTFVRSRTDKLGIDKEFYKTKDIHIHATEAAIPKDGPSAGVTMAIGLISVLTERKVRRDIAMTGEITIRGRVLPIGGLKEKSMAAYRGGVTTVFIPKENEADLEDVDAVIKEKLTFVPVSHIDEIIEKALEK